MNRFLVIAGLVILGSVVVFLGRGVNQNAVPERGEDDPPPQSQTKTLPKTPLAPTAVPTPAAGPDPSEETVGDPATAKRHLLVGWVYDEANEVKPETLTVPLQAVRDYVRKSGGAASAEIVNLDVPKEDRSPAAQAVTDLGVSLDGQTLTDGNLSNAPGAVEVALKAVK